MPGLNKVEIIGHLGKDPELRTLESGSVCTFSIATSEEWKDKVTQEKKNRTEWHNIVVWGKLGEVCAKYLRKGAQVYVCGKLRTRSWEKDNVTRYTTEIFVDDMLMLGKKEGGHDNAPPVTQNPKPSGSAQQPAAPADASDELPF